MDRSTRRRRLGIIAIVVAALASAGTSPAPTPSPDLSATKQDSLTLTADAPVAWIDITPNEDASLIAADGQTALIVSATALDQGVYLIAEQLGAPGSVSQGVGNASWTAICPVGAACTTAIRLTAILFDPAGHPSVDVQYTATAETRFRPNSGPVPSAAIDVDVSDVGHAAAPAVSTTAPEEIHLGPDVPRAIRHIHMSLPEGPAPDAVLGPNAILLTRDLAGRPDYEQDILVRSVAESGATDLRYPGSMLSPFTTCEPGTPCEADFDLEFTWLGGTADGSGVEWSLAAWPGLSNEAAVAAAVIDPAVASDVAWDGPMLKASTSGSTPLTGTSGWSVSLDAALDLSDVAQGVGHVDGLLRMTFRATLNPGIDPAATIRVGIGGNATAVATAGQTITLYSQAVDVTCSGRSRCRPDVRYANDAAFVVGFNRDTGDPANAVLDWTAEVEFLRLGGDPVPPDGSIDLVRPSPSP